MNNQNENKPERKNKSLIYEGVVCLGAVAASVFAYILLKQLLDYLFYRWTGSDFLFKIMFLVQYAAILTAYLYAIKAIAMFKQVLMKSSKSFKGGMVYWYKRDVIVRVLRQKRNVIINSVENGRINRLCACTLYLGHHAFSERKYFAGGKEYSAVKLMMEKLEETFPDGLIPVVKINGRSPGRYPFHYEWTGVEMNNKEN